jgi:hypothetical protein
LVPAPSARWLPAWALPSLPATTHNTQ